MQNNKVQIIVEMIKKGENILQEIKSQLGNIEPQASAAGRSLNSVGDSAINVGNIFKAIFGVAAVVEIKKATSAVFNFLGVLETAQLGIASSFLTAGQYIDTTTGKALTGTEALKAAQVEAKKIVEELQVANFRTIATLDQLVRAYQETLPVAMQKGFDKGMVKDFTVAVVQAAGAIGLSLDQLAEETRSLLSGTINPRTSRIGVALGLTNEDIRKNSGNAKQLFDFLMQKLDAYTIAGIESQTTWKGLWSNIKDIALKSGGQLLEPVFSGVKNALTDISGSIMTINSETKKIEWNPSFLSGVETFRTSIIDLWDILSSFPKGIFEYLKELRGEMNQTERATQALQNALQDKSGWESFKRLNYDAGSSIVYFAQTTGATVAFIIGELKTFADGAFRILTPVGTMIAGVLTLDVGQIKKGWEDWKSVSVQTMDELNANWAAYIKSVDKQWDEHVKRISHLPGVSEPTDRKNPYNQNPPPKPENKEEKDHYSSRLSALKEFLSAQLHMEESNSDAYLDMLERSHRRGLVSEDDFYAARKQEIRQSTQDELALISKYEQDKYALYSAAWDKEKTQAGKKALTEKYDAEQAELTAQRIKLKNEEAKKLDDIDLKREEKGRQRTEATIDFELKMTEKGIEQRLAAELAGIEKQAEQNDFLRATQLISEEQYFTNKMELLNRETAARKKALEDQFEAFVRSTNLEIDLAGEDVEKKLELNRKIELAMKAFYGNIDALATDSTSKRTKLEREAAEEQIRNINKVRDALESAFVEMFDRPKEAFKNFGKFILDELKRTAARALANPIVIPIYQMMYGAGTTIGANGQVMPGTGGATGWLQNTLDTPLWGSEPLQGPTLTGAPMSGTGGGFTVGNALGVAGGAYGVYNAYQSGDPLSGAMSGAMAGTAIAPGIGTVIGAVIGGLAGIFGGDDSNPHYTMGFEPDTQWTGGGERVRNTPDNGIMTMYGYDGPVPDAFSGPLLDTFVKMRSDVKSILDDMGMDVTGFAKKWEYTIDMEGKSQEQMQAEIQAAMADYIQFASGIDFSVFKDGEETLIQTITRIIDAMSAIQSIKDLDIQAIFDRINTHALTMKESLVKTREGFKTAYEGLKDLTGKELGDEITKLGATAIEIRQQEVAYLVHIKELQEGMDDAVQAQIDKYKDAGMTVSERLNVLYTDLTKQWEKFNAETDPDNLNGIAGQIMQSTEASWQILSQLKTLVDQVSQLIASTLESFDMDVMDKQHQLEYINSQIMSLRHEYANTTDPEERANIAQNIDKYMKMGWGLLSDEEKNASLPWIHQVMDPMKADMEGYSITIEDVMKNQLIPSLELLRGVIQDKLAKAIDDEVAAIKDLSETIRLYPIQVQVNVDVDADGIVTKSVDTTLGVIAYEGAG